MVGEHGPGQRFGLAGVRVGEAGGGQGGGLFPAGSRRRGQRVPLAVHELPVLPGDAPVDGLVLASLEAASYLPPGEMLQQQLVIEEQGARPRLPFHYHQVDSLGQAQGIIGKRVQRLAFHVHLFREPGPGLAQRLGDVLPALQQGVGQPGHGLFEGLDFLRAESAAAGPLGLVF